MHHLILVVAHLPALVAAHPKLPGVVAVRFGAHWADIVQTAECIDQDLARDLGTVADSCEQDVVVAHDLPEDRRSALHLFVMN